MADGILCKHCGWQETEHDFTDEEVEEDLGDRANSLLSGKKKTLVECRQGRGYVPENQRLARQLNRQHEKREYRRSMGGLNPSGD